MSDAQQAQQVVVQEGQQLLAQPATEVAHTQEEAIRVKGQHAQDHEAAQRAIAELDALVAQKAAGVEPAREAALDRARAEREESEKREHEMRERIDQLEREKAESAKERLGRPAEPTLVGGSGGPVGTRLDRPVGITG